MLVVWMDRVLSARPHVADHSVQAFQVHLTLLQGPRMENKYRVLHTHIDIVATIQLLRYIAFLSR